MKLHSLRLLFLFAALTLSYTSVKAQSSEAHIPGHVILLLHPDYSLATIQQDLLRSSSNKPLVLRKVRTLSPRLRLHLMTFDSNTWTDQEVLRQVSKHPAVLLAQFDHAVELRSPQATTPDDPQFAQQWALENTGQFGGLADADIDATDAWDITTGGLSALGDTIVVAVIDEGIFLPHEDLNLWKNHAEIPGNGQDDDQNGYIDDVDGWNAYQPNGNVPNSSHGTHVAGIIGAIGNNALGVSGVNWDVQVMPVAGSSSNESIVMEAYGYVLEQRRRYNESNGMEGAFVVATNSSFGVNFADPANYPIWCALYDSLGEAGIVNVVATMNNNSDVDAVGDVPSACTSEYVIAVTNTTSTDQKNGGAAFGLVNIDLGAPGTQVMSTIPNSSYGLNTGTSMAAPQVAGAVSLLVAAACPAQMVQYRNAPGQTALQLRDFILDGVDATPALNNITATGGRLNVYNSLLIQTDSCAGLPTDCLPPFQLVASQIIDTSLLLSWQALDTSAAFRLRYRLAGSNPWLDTLPVSGLSLQLDGLQPCTAYEYQVETSCNPGSSGFFATFPFQTEGCCEAPPNLSVQAQPDSSFLVTWGSVFGTLNYELQYRVAGAPLWQMVSPVDTFFTLNGLQLCTSYEFTVAAICGPEAPDFSDTLSITSLGCGACLDIDYCATQGQNVSFEWVESVRIGPIDNTTGANNGYGDFTDLSYQFRLDSTYQMLLTPGYQGFAFDEVWRIWVDLDQNGSFDSLELLFDPGPASGPVTGGLSFPAGTPGGATRMRVAMRFPGFDGQGRPIPCGNFGEGEVEDYCITLTAGDSVFCPNPSTLQAEYVPGTDSLWITWAGGNAADSAVLELENLSAQQLAEIPVTGDSFLIQNLPACESFRVRVRSFCGAFASGFTPYVAFQSRGCGACFDQAYCRVEGADANLEWIAQVAGGSVSVASGPDGGYGDYRNVSFGVTRGDTLTLFLTPGFASQARPISWVLGLDWDQNGEFQASEAIVAADSSLDNPVTIQVPIPEDAFIGTTRLRIVMQRNDVPGLCAAPDFGEVEDYCIAVNPSVSNAPTLETMVKVFPNPGPGLFTLESDQPIFRWSVYDLQGRSCASGELAGQSRGMLDVRQLSNGLYLLRVETSAGPTGIRLQKR